MTMIKGRLIGRAAGKATPGLRELAWRAGGRWRPWVSPHTGRITFYTETAGDWLDLPLPGTAGG